MSVSVTDRLGGGGSKISISALRNFWTTLMYVCMFVLYYVRVCVCVDVCIIICTSLCWCVCL